MRAPTPQGVPGGRELIFLNAVSLLVVIVLTLYHSCPRVFSAQQPWLSFKMLIRSCHVFAQNLLMVSHLRVKVKVLGL